jgi:hypothetical protein
LTYFIKVVEIKPEIKKSNRELSIRWKRMDIMKNINVLIKSLRNFTRIKLLMYILRSREERGKELKNLI